MTENQTSRSGWTSVQAYGISALCLLLGVAIGYLGRGSGAPQATASGKAQATGAPAGMTAPDAAAAAPQRPTPEQLRQMADTQAAPLLAQLKDNPNDANLLYQIGNLYYDARQYPEAVRYYESSLKIKPEATDVRTDMATAYHFMGEPDRALEQYAAVLKIDPKHANALFNTGMVKWQDKQDISGAIAAWKKLLATNPNYAGRDRVQGLIAQAEQHLSMGSGPASAKPPDKAN